MSIIDISQSIDLGSPVYPGDQPFGVHTCKSQDSCVSDFSMSAHLGTHVDAPSHLNLGHSIDQIDLTTFIGPCQLIDLTGVEAILPQHLQTVCSERVLIKTGFCLQATWPTSYPYLTKKAAIFLTDHGVKLLGIDTPSVDPEDSDLPAHRVLLSSKTVILENLQLLHAPSGFYRLTALPLKLRGLEASPVRAVLEPLNE